MMWLRRAVSRSEVTDTAWPSAARITSPAWMPASAAPEPALTSMTWTWVPPPSLSTVVTVMPKEGAPR